MRENSGKVVNVALPRARVGKMAKVTVGEKAGSTKKNAGPIPGHFWEEKELAEQKDLGH